MTRRHRTSRPRQQADLSGHSRGGGRLRIIGGEYRRRLLPVLDSPGLRPTPDRVRETLFNWLATAPSGARALDLYAGTGALGLEALSRGARDVLFVERSAKVAAALEANLATLGANGQVIAGDALSYLSTAHSLAASQGDDTRFSLAFLDPPFRQGLAAPSCAALESGGWLAERAWIYVETESELVPDVPTNWLLHREVRAGDSHGRLYRRQPSPDGDAC